MGSNTYKAAKNKIKINEGQLRIVMTRSPKKYQPDELPGQLEFKNETPKSLVKQFKDKGHSKLLVLGGGMINSIFIKFGLVNEIYLTVEPLIFAKGKSLVNDAEFKVTLKLVSFDKMHTQ